MSNANPTHSRWRALRPLIWWGILVLVLFLIRTHERLSEQTRLSYEIRLGNRSVNYEADTRVDSRKVENRSRVAIGRRTLSITHPKSKSFTTNLFVWYGPLDLGTIPLERAMGTLALSVDPPAQGLSIHGPEFTVVLTNSTGLTSSVPTDSYVIQAGFKHTKLAENVTVYAGDSATRKLQPKIGVANITCNQEQATFELAGMGGEVLERGGLPALLTEIPEGRYRLTLWHHGNRKDVDVKITSGTTNDLRTEFQYGTVILETDPAGATVEYDGRDAGVTPLILTERLPGQRGFTLAREGYEGVVGVLEVIANQTNHFQTNLLSRQYTAAMRAAQSYFERGRFDDAAASVTEALKHKSEDEPAKLLLRNAIGLGRLARARDLGQREEFTAAIRELNAALEALPENEDAKALLADYQTREAERLAVEEKRAAELAEQQRVRREAEQAEERARQKKTQLQTAFDTLVRGFPDFDKFQQHELVTSKSVGNSATAIKEALVNERPGFKIVRSEQPRPDIFGLQARQIMELTYRDCIIVAGQVKDGETRILFKVLEYDHPPTVNLLGGILQGAITRQDPDGRIAAQFRRQVQEGVPMVRERIRRALDE